MPAHAPESPYAWQRLCVSVLLGTVGTVGLWSAIVALPAVQAEFGVARGSASLPYTATMIGAALGGVLMGRLADRVGIVLPIVVGALALGIGYAAASVTTSLWQFALVQGAVIGFLGSAAVFGPLIADISHWFTRNRGKAVSICASASYLAGTVWPPILEHAIAAYGWRATHLGVGILCVTIMLPLSLALRPRAPVLHEAHAPTSLRSALRVSPNLVQIMLVIAGFSCCVAMSMPQVHIVAYCGDLGYGPARGAEMLSLMLGFGVVSRLISGWISDRIGGVPTMLAGSALQCLALVFYIPFDGLTSLYVVSALFGLSQGGIVPSYAMIVREYFPAQDVGGRFGTVLMATIFGMAAGGWMSGVVFDWTGSYQAAFLNGILWNLLNASIAVWLLRQPRGRAVHA
ncbi:MAG: MFS transporter [Acidobacteriota bacterium]